MNNLEVLNGIDPACVLKHFAEISEIDRASGRENAIANHIMSLAISYDYDCKSDPANNVIVWIPASAGKENVPELWLQAHIDMVAVDANEEDFDTSVIEFVIEDGKLKANGTTLGADNGIGVAAMLALMTEEKIVHGPLVLLFTATEETGLIGANALDHKDLSCNYLLNLDSEDWQEVTVGCAGGGRIQGIFRDDIGETVDGAGPVSLYEILILGLRGGHSGIDIDKNCGNAIVLLARILTEVFEKWPTARLAAFNGGSKMNSIPSIAKVELAMTGVGEEEVAAFISEKEQEIYQELMPVEPKFRMEVKTVMHEASEGLYFSGEFQAQLIQMLQLLPNGVVRTDPNNPALLMSSNNIGVIKTEGNRITVTSMYRSASNTHKKYLKGLITATFKRFGAVEVEFGSEYPAWVPVYSSYLLKLIKSTFSTFFDQDMKVTTVHGGLECAVFADFWPGVEIASFGPQINSPHSIDEEVDLLTVANFWWLLQLILAEFNPQQ